MTRAERLGHNSLPRCSRDEALELALHHLRLFHNYWMSSPNNNEENKEEVKRILLLDGPEPYLDEFLTTFDLFDGRDRAISAELREDDDVD